jgi:hypothetical protein
VRTEAVHFVNSGELIVTLDIAADAPLGAYDVQVEDRKGKQGIGTELIDIDSTSVSGTWDLTMRLHTSTGDCSVVGPLRLAQNANDIHGSALLGLVCPSGVNGPVPMPVTGTAAANGHDLTLELGDPGCELQGVHESGSASGDVLPCSNLADIPEFVSPPDSLFTGTWQAERR